MTTLTPRRGRREANKAVNRAAILLAARQVFAELGYGTATVRDIIRKTDLAAGTFYNYFPDKESVLRALVEEHAARARTSLREARQNSPTARDFVQDGFRSYFELVASDRATFELVRRNLGTIRTLFDEPVLGAGARDLAEDLRAGMTSGLLAEHDAEYMAAAMVGAAFEIAVRMAERTPADIDGAVEFAAALFVPGLAPAR